MGAFLRRARIFLVTASFFCYLFVSHVSSLLEKNPSLPSIQKRESLLFPFVDRYAMRGNVTVRSEAWSEKFMPLQVYRGSRVEVAKGPTFTLSNYTGKGLSKSSQSLVEQYEDLPEEKRRQLIMKMAAEARAAQPLDPNQHLHILYYDEHICVTSKPSGILSVPGPRRNPSLAALVHQTLAPDIHVDKMVVHRIDMDTSGIIVYALTEIALKQLHEDFRQRRVKKSYQALLCGHLLAASEIEVDVGLERDPFHPPFMRVAQSRGEILDSIVHPSFQKYILQAPKPSLTEVVVRSLEYLRDEEGMRLPVTRVELTPHTGRTHQLRVHTAALGYPIIGDDIYGYLGEGDCGIDHSILDKIDPDRCAVNRRIHNLEIPLCLHAERLSFLHPLTRAPMSFQCEAPF
jgi:tRNA pseudouridine32 synthase/23S rRNA pseudouridine746 synthase